MSESDLRVNYLGLKLKNPVIVSAGPWSRDSTTIKKALKSGASAVVTASIVTETSPTHRPRLFYKDKQLANIRLYSEMTLEDWKRTIGEVKDTGGTIIASIMGESPSEIAYIAEAVERFGADAIEIGAASPLGEGLEIKCSDPEFVYDCTSAATESVGIPVSVKLSATVTNPLACAKAAEQGGAAGISGIDAVRSLIGVDIETAKPLLDSLGGLSGPSIRPIALAVISMVSDVVKMPVCGIGGIENYRDVVEYIMVGATAVQLGSSILLHGWENITKIINELQQWMDSHNYDSIENIRGLASGKISSFQDLRAEPLVAGLSDECMRDDCMFCRNSCTFDAVEYNNGIVIDKEKCSGCGICINLCPQNIISLNWNGN